MIIAATRQILSLLSGCHRSDPVAMDARRHCLDPVSWDFALAGNNTPLQAMLVLANRKMNIPKQYYLLFLRFCFNFLMFVAVFVFKFKSQKLKSIRKKVPASLFARCPPVGSHPWRILASLFWNALQCRLPPLEMMPFPRG